MQLQLERLLTRARGNKGQRRVEIFCCYLAFFFFIYSGRVGGGWWDVQVGFEALYKAKPNELSPTQHTVLT